VGVCVRAQDSGVCLCVCACTEFHREHLERDKAEHVERERESARGRARGWDRTRVSESMLRENVFVSVLVVCV
jgi:hypothetical protein